MSKVKRFKEREPEGTLGHTIKNLPLSEIQSVMDEFPLKTVPKEHQAKCVYLSIDQPSWFYALEMGLGKTKLGLDIITTNKFLGLPHKTLVTCFPIVLRQWRKEIKKHSDLSGTIIDNAGGDKLERLENSDTDLTVVSHNWLVSLFGRADKDPKLAKRVQNAFKGFNILIIDEAHALKNPKTKGFKGFKKYLLHIPKRYLMTGTPIGNDWMGVWSQYYILDKGDTFGRSFSGFLANYFNAFYNGRWTFYSLKSTKRAEFMRKFWGKILRWEDSECNDLPEKTYTVFPVEMTPEQEKIYDEILESENLTEFELMKVTAGLHTKESPKMDALCSITEELCVENKKQFIVWSWLKDEHTYIVETLRKKFPKLKIFSINGETSDKDKDTILKDWAKNKVDIIIANQKSLGIGVDLIEAQTACFFSNNLSLIDRKQSEKRIHRTGQTQHCKYIDLICEKTVDEINLARIQKAQDTFTELLRDTDMVSILRSQRL